MQKLSWAKCHFYTNTPLTFVESSYETNLIAIVKGEIFSNLQNYNKNILFLESNNTKIFILF